VSAEKLCFTIRASASRLDKGLLAVPQRFKDWFPNDKRQIQVVFDDEHHAKLLTFHPRDATFKESEIFGLGNWFSRRGVREGDLISITLEDAKARLYRIVLDRYLRDREEQKVRLRSQPTIDGAFAVGQEASATSRSGRAATDRRGVAVSTASQGTSGRNRAA
jgi:hypothetical protein